MDKLGWVFLVTFCVDILFNRRDKALGAVLHLHLFPLQWLWHEQCCSVSLSYKAKERGHLRCHKQGMLFHLCSNPYGPCPHISCQESSPTLVDLVWWCQGRRPSLTPASRVPTPSLSFCGSTHWLSPLPSHALFQDSEWVRTISMQRSQKSSSRCQSCRHRSGQNQTEPDIHHGPHCPALRKDWLYQTLVLPHYCVNLHERAAANCWCIQWPITCCFAICNLIFWRFTADCPGKD